MLGLIACGSDSTLSTSCLRSRSPAGTRSRTRPCCHPAAALAAVAAELVGCGMLLPGPSELFPKAPSLIAAAGRLRSGELGPSPAGEETPDGTTGGEEGWRRPQ